MRSSAAQAVFGLPCPHSVPADEAAPFQMSKYYWSSQLVEYSSSSGWAPPRDGVGCRAVGRTVVPWRLRRTWAVALRRTGQQACSLQGWAHVYCAVEWLVGLPVGIGVESGYYLSTFVEYYYCCWWHYFCAGFSRLVAVAPPLPEAAGPLQNQRHAVLVALVVTAAWCLLDCSLSTVATFAVMLGGSKIRPLLDGG